MKKLLSGLEDSLCSLILLAMAILTCINVFARYVFQSSMPFVEELTTLGLVIISLSGAAVAAKRGAHPGLAVVTDLFPDKAQKWFTLLGHVLGVIFGAVMLYHGILMSQLEKRLDFSTAGMQWPEWMFGMFVPISGAVILIRYIQLAVQTLRKEDSE